MENFFVFVFIQQIVKMLNEEISKCIIATKAFKHLMHFYFFLFDYEKKLDFLLGRSPHKMQISCLKKKQSIFRSSVFPNLLSANKRISRSRCLTSRPSPTATLTPMAAKLIICGSEHLTLLDNRVDIQSASNCSANVQRRFRLCVHHHFSYIIRLVCSVCSSVSLFFFNLCRVTSWR